MKIADDFSIGTTFKENLRPGDTPANFCHSLGDTWAVALREGPSCNDYAECVVIAVDGDFVTLQVISHRYGVDMGSLLARNGWLQGSLN